MRRLLLPSLAAALVALAGCHHAPEVTPASGRLRLTSTEIDSMWNNAVALYQKRDWRKAGTLLERVQLEMPIGDKRIPLARFYLGEARLGEKSNLQAVREFRRVADEFPNDSLAAPALVRAGDAYLKLWRRPELDPTYGQSAYATYQEVVTRYPGTEAAKTADLRIKDIENRFAIKEYKAALYYIRFKAYDSAILYLRNIIVTWPRAETVPDALMKLVSTYRLLGYVEDTNETCAYFRRQWPESPKLAASCPVAKDSAAVRPAPESTKGP